MLPDADIDDKIIARAEQANEDPLSLSRRSALLFSFLTSLSSFQICQAAQPRCLAQRLLTC